MRRLHRTAAIAIGAALVSIFPIGAREEQRPRFYVTEAGAALVAQGLAAPAPTGADANGFEEVPAPGVRYVPTRARSTNVPWIDSNGWRYLRGLRRANYATLPAGAAALAAAEAFAFGAEAILNPDPADVDQLGAMLRFLREHDAAPLPPRTNIAVVDDKSPMMGEVLNMLTRRNLLYRVVPSPDPQADLTVVLGSDEFPADKAANPYEFALLVRQKLGDDRRLLRLYGTNTVIARLTGDADRARLFLLSYAGRRGQQGGRSQQATRRTPDSQAMQVRLLGRWQPRAFAGFGAADGADLSDLRHVEGATEFWVPEFETCAIVDLDALK